MGKAGKWIKSILTGGKKDKKKPNLRNHPPCAVLITEDPITRNVIPPTTPKEKRRWSFRRSSATAPGPKDSSTTSSNESTPTKAEQTKPQSVAAVMIHADVDSNEAAATKIQAVFRSYLARKALRALRGLVKLQALVRGHLVRRRATATLRCMQALVTAQARARAQRLRSAEEGKLYKCHRHSYHEVEKGMTEESIKTVEMDLGEAKGSSNTTRNNYSYYYYYDNDERRDDRFSTKYASEYEYVNKNISPAPSAITDMSPRTISGYFNQEYAESLCYEYPMYPNYMANTQSSRAKARSQSAPKQRPDSFEKQPSRRRPSVEGRGIPRAVRMQRSSSHLGATAQSYQYPWSIKLDKSAVSLLDSECGSTCSVLTTANYIRS